jgi:PAS domain S-box-containing protein
MSKNGNRFEIIMTITPVKNESGKVIAIAGIGRDITEITRAMEINARQKEQLRVTLASIGDAVIATDRNGIVTVINGVASKLTGYSEQEAIGKPIKEVFHIVNENTREPVEIPVDTVMRKGAVVGMANHTVVISRQGNETMIADSAAPTVDSEGRITGIVMVFRDATEEKLTERRRITRQTVSGIIATETSLKSALSAMGREMCSNLKFQAMAIWLPDEVDGKLHLAAHSGDNDASDSALTEVTGNKTFEIGAGLSGKVFETGKPIWVSDLASSSIFEWKPGMEKTNLKSGLGIPLLNRGKTEGAMLFFSNSGLQVDSNLINTMGDLGKQIGHFIGRLKVEEANRTLLHNLESFIKNTPRMIVAMDVNGIVTSVNDSFEKVYGWRREEIVGKSIECIVPENLREEIRERLKLVAAGGHFTYDALRMKKDGSRIWVNMTVSPVEDANGKVTHLSSIAKDITEEKLAEAEIRLKNEVIENLHELVVISKQDDAGNPVIFYTNPAYCTATGYLKEEVIGKTLWDLQGEATDSASLNRMYSAYVSGGVFSGEVIGYSKSGKVTYLDTTFFPMKNGPEGTTVWVLIQKDVTELALNNEKLQKANEKLNLMETISRHDMLNHLQAVDAYVQIISNSAVDDVLSNRVSKIKNVTERMKNQLESLKELQNSGNPRWMNVQATFRESLKGLDLKEVKVRIIGGDAAIMADPLLERVFSNLVGNTMRHGGMVKTITLEVEDKTDHLQIAYSDDGKGIPEDRKAVIFKVEENKPLHGLKLIRDILEMTHMTINEVGTEGKGTRFEIKVPKGNYRLLERDTGRLDR